MFKTVGLLNKEIMSYKEIFALIEADYQQYSSGGGNFNKYIKMMWINRGFAYSVWLRLSSVKGILWPFARIIHHHLSTKYRITIQPQTKISGGIFFPNCWNIVINPRCIISKNVTIHEYVNIGANNGVSSYIGENVTINPRACIVGAITIGKNAVVNTGSVVTRDVAPYIIVEGNPAKKIDL